MRNENDEDAATAATDEQGADGAEQHSSYGEDDEHSYVDRDKIDFDPEDGLLAGTAVDGTSEIPDSPSNQEDDDSTDDTNGEDGG